MKLRKDIAVSEKGLVFNPLTGESFSVNPIGVEIIGLLREEMDFGRISEVILDKYKTDLATFERDYNDFIGLLSQSHLLEDEEENA